MLLNATHVTPESESYPDLPNQKRMQFPDGFPMPAAKPQPQSQSTPSQDDTAPFPLYQCSRCPTFGVEREMESIEGRLVCPDCAAKEKEPPTATDTGNSALGDPYLSERDAAAMEQRGVNAANIKSAYHWMGAKTLHGTAAGNGHWQPCVGGDYNRITGHWREPDGDGGYNLYTIFEVAVRLDCMPSVHDARLKLFDEQARGQYKSDKAQAEADAEVGKVEEPAKPAPPPVDTKSQSEALGRRVKELEEQAAQEKSTLAPTDIFLKEIRMARDRLIEAACRVKTAETHFDFCFTICELDAAVDEMCVTIELELEEARRREANRKQPSPKVEEPSQTLPTCQWCGEQHEGGPENCDKAESECINHEGNGPDDGMIQPLELTTLEEMGIAKGTCNILQEHNIENYQDVISHVLAGTHGELDWNKLTEIPKIGKQKVESIRGACEKLQEKMGQ